MTIRVITVLFISIFMITILSNQKKKSFIVKALWMLIILQTSVTDYTEITNIPSDDSSILALFLL